MRPNFFVIGAPRSGTTWLYHNLKSHPEIFLSETKELHFFDRSYENGMDYYEEHFRGSEGFKRVGEMTPQYLYSEVVATRIKEHIENPKFIVLLRNPTDRLYSSYWNFKSKKKEAADVEFEDDIRQRTHLIEEGFYAKYLPLYFGMFGKENVFVGYYEDVKENPEKLLSEIFEFLNVDASYDSGLSSQKINTASSKKYLAGNSRYRLLSKFFKKIRLQKLGYYFENKNITEYPPMKLETKKMLVNDTYFQANRDLEKLMGTDVSHWDVI
jgi:hypothetical protein